MRNKIIYKVILIVFLYPTGVGAEQQCLDEFPAFHQLRNSENDTIEGPFPVDEIERTHMFENRATGEIKPFGYSNDEWEQLKAQMREGDEIYFTTHSESGFYQEGHILVRDDCVIFFLLGEIT